MEILFKNTTKYSKTVYQEFLQFHNEKMGFKYNLHSVQIISLLLFFAIIQIKCHNIDLATIFCFLIACFFFWRYLYPAMDVSKNYNSEKIQNEQEFTFTFYDKYFTVQNQTEMSHVKYSQIYKIFETPTFLYLYVDETHSLLVDKKTFSIGSSDKFSDFISRKCWYKFKIEKNLRFM